MTALIQIIQNHALLVIRKIRHRPVANDQIRILWDSIISEKIDARQRQTALIQHFPDTVGQTSLAVSIDFIDRFHHITAGRGNRTGYLPFPVKLRLPVLAVVIVAHLVELNDVRKRNRHMLSCGFTGDKQAVILGIIAGYPGRMQHRVNLLHLDMSGKLLVFSNHGTDSVVHAVRISYHINRDILLQSRQHFLRGIADFI